MEGVIWSARSFGSSALSDGTGRPKDGKGQAPPIGPIHGQETALPLSSLPHASVTSSLSTLNLSTEAVQEASSKSTLALSPLDNSFHQPQGDLPSPYLQNLCPLCFNITFNKLKEILKGVPDAAL